MKILVLVVYEVLLNLPDLPTIYEKSFNASLHPSHLLQVVMLCLSDDGRRTATCLRNYLLYVCIFRCI